MKEKLGEGEWISVDTEDEMVVNFYYPQIFEAEYLRSCVRLEIGPLAEWLPCHETSITPFAAEKYPIERTWNRRRMGRNRSLCRWIS